MIGHIFGCHSCGIRYPPEPGLWVADHQPPNNIAKGKANEPLRHMVFRLTGGRLGGRPPQQFYPHCVECSNLQVRSRNPDQSENGEVFVAAPLHGAYRRGSDTVCALNVDVACFSKQGSAVKMNRRHLVHHLSNVLAKSSSNSRRHAESSIRRMALRTHRWHFAGIITCGHAHALPSLFACASAVATSLYILLGAQRNVNKVGFWTKRHDAFVVARMHWTPSPCT